MGTIFERLNHELEAFGRKAQAAIDEGRFHIELIRLRRQRDEAACNLGRLVHKRERGADVEPARIDGLLLLPFDRTGRRPDRARERRP